MLSSTSVAASVAIATGSTLEALICVWLLSRFSDFDRKLTRLYDFSWLLVAVAASACIGAAIGVSALSLTNQLPLQGIPLSLLHWWQGGALGTILLTLLILVWHPPPNNWVHQGRTLEATILFSLTVFVGLTPLLGWFKELSILTITSWSFLLVIWAAIRFRIHGALVVISVAVIQIMLSSLQAANLHGSGLNLWTHMVALTIIGTIVALTTEHTHQSVTTKGRNRDARLKTITDSGLIAVWEIDLKTNLSTWDDNMLSLYGLLRKDFSGTHADWVKQIHPEDVAKAEALQTDAINHHKAYKAEFRIITAKGEIRYIKSRGQIIKTSAGEPTHMIGTSWDNWAYTHTQHQLQLAHTAINKSNTAFFWMTTTGQVSDINDFACASLGYTHDELIGMNAWDFDPDYKPEHQASTWEKIKKDKVLIFETRHQKKDGTIFPVEITANFLNLYGKEQVFCSVQNISDRKAAEESIRLAASVYENSSEAMTVADPDGTILTVNPAFTKITGYSSEEVVGKNRGVLSSGRHNEEFFETMWGDINATGNWQGEVWDRRKNGEIYPAWLTINTVYDKDGAVYRRIYLFSDNTAWKESEALIWRQANFDTLTQLPNRQMFRDRLTQDIKKADRSNKSLILMFLDLDWFKEINDSLGHDIGDKLLQETAKRISSCVREVDMVARLGGDEFTIILNEFDPDNSASRIASEILNKLSEPFFLNEKMSYISASIGITTYPKDTKNIDELIKNADQAMYEAKNLGRNRYIYFTPSMQENARYKMQMADDLRLAIAEKQLFLVYQPIVQLSTGIIHKAEALLRWQHPKFGLTLPSQFIPIAEHTGLILDIGDWAFRQSITQVKHWNEVLQQEIQVSVNVSPVQFNDRSKKFAPIWTQLKEAGLNGKHILVEITESLLLKANTSTNNQLLAFRDAGIQVALDDFGTGYSSMSYLKAFDIDYIKIDQSFISGISTKSDDMALCEAMIIMAHKLNMLVIAEGVETTEQRDLLLKMGCDYAQGYLFSKPVSPDDFEMLLEKQLQT